MDQDKNQPKTEAAESKKDALVLSLSNLSPASGSHHRKKIVGRGVGSGHGRHATRGMKGQRSRSGDSKMIGFEGGQTPILRRIPKRGFTRPNRRTFTVLNVGVLNEHFKPHSEITSEGLFNEGLIRTKSPVKILGDGDMKKPLKISVESVSKRAKEKILAAGGSVQVL